MLRSIKVGIKKALGKAGFTKGENLFASRQYGKFEAYSTIYKDENDKEYLLTHIRILTHELEKGFSLPKPRMGFGKQKLEMLDHLLDIYEKKNYDREAQVYKNAVKTVAFYISKASEYQLDVSFLSSKRYQVPIIDGECGIRNVPRDEFLQAQYSNFQLFSHSRHSVRSYQDRQLSESDVKKAILIAQTAPSACNRQSGKVFHVSGKEICRSILEIQGGAKGFSDVNDIFIVASDLASYTGMFEATTCFVDSGLFAMNLLQGLHFVGIGSCPLLWNDESERGINIRKVVDIPERYEITMVIPAGYYEEQIRYAVSPRKPIEEVYLKVGG